MKTLRDTLAHIARVFRPRNRDFIPGFADRAFALLAAVDNVQDGTRKGAPKRQLADALADVAVRTFHCVEASGNIRFIETLAAKYPVTKCVYCHRRPCECTERRKKHVLVAPNSVQCGWSFRQWCRSFQATYGKKNKERGVYYCLTRLFGEVAEFAALHPRNSRRKYSRRAWERDIALELADVFGWTIAVANVLGVDLAAAVERRFSDGCDICGKRVCVCAHYDTHRTVWRIGRIKTK